MIKKYLPVWVEENGAKRISGTDYINCRNENGDYLFAVRIEELESSPLYSADELLEILRKVEDMPCTEVKKLYGEEYYGELYKKCSASEIIEKYRAYESTPKVGQKWKSKYADTFAYITSCGDGRIYYIYRDGSCGSSTKDDFFNTFGSKVRDADETILAFLDKLKGGEANES